MELVLNPFEPSFAGKKYQNFFEIISKLVFRLDSQGRIWRRAGGANQKRSIPFDGFLGTCFDLAKKGRPHFEFLLRCGAPAVPLSNIPKSLRTPFQLF
jgi:hypothetical protein